MKKTIFKVKNSDDDDIQTIKFFLQQEAEEINLMAEDSNGYDWYIATITEDGQLKLSADVPTNLGLQLNSGGHIKTYDE